MYLVAVGSGLNGLVYVYKLQNTHAKLVDTVQLDQGHTCKGLSFLCDDSDINTEEGHVCLHVLTGLRKENGAGSLTSVSVRCEYKLSSMFVYIKKDIDLSLIHI